MSSPLFFDPSNCRNETEVESKFVVQYLLPTLGYNPNTWNQEVVFGSIRLDFLVFARQILPFKIARDSPLALIIEVKGPRQNLNKHIGKISRYIRSLNATYGVLTNGKDFRIYGKKDNDIKQIFRCTGKEIPDRLSEIKNLIGYEEIAQVKMPNSSAVEIDLSISSKSDLLYTNTASVPSERKAPLPSLTEAESKPKAKDKLMKTIAVYHNKGGVGKTTTVVNLGAALARKGYRVLLIDLDSQANTTFATGLIKSTFDEDNELTEKNFSRLLITNIDRNSVNDVMFLNASYCSSRVDVIPSHINVAPKEVELMAKETGTTALRLYKKLSEVSGFYDFVIIDCPPSLGLYARIGLTTCDYLIIPSDMKPFSNQGIVNVINYIQEINLFRDDVGRGFINVLGILPSKIMTHPKYLEYTFPKIEARVARDYNLPIFESRIYERSDLAKCLSNEIYADNLVIPDPKSIFDFNSNSQSANEFEALTNEILNKIGQSV